MREEGPLEEAYLVGDWEPVMRRGDLVGGRKAQVIAILWTRSA
jgi:hypothetical protein